MKPINVGLLGIGTVGGGTWEVLNRNADEIRRRAGPEMPMSMAGAVEPAAGDAAGVLRARVDVVRLLVAFFAIVMPPCVVPWGGPLQRQYAAAPAD